MSGHFVHTVRPLGRGPQTRSGVRTLCMAMAVVAIFAAPLEAQADCPAAPLTSTDDMVVSFLAGQGGTQAAPSTLFASTVKEGMLVYDDTANALKLCDGTTWVSLLTGIGTENDPQIDTLTANKWCAANAGGTAIDCTQDAPSLVETDPTIGTLTTGKWCSTDGSVIMCTADAPSAAPTADSLDFTEFKDAMALDANTDIALDGTEVLSISNAGTGLSLRINDDGSTTDPTPFVIDAAGNVGVGTASPSYAVDAVGSIRSIADNSYNGLIVTAYSDTKSPYNLFYRARGVRAAATQVMANDYLGAIGFRGHDGTALFSQDGARIMALASENGSVGHGAILTFHTASNGSTGGPPERMRIDSAGNVGIGTTAPNASALLDVSSTTKGFLPPRMTTAHATGIASPADGLMVYDTDTDTIKLRANGAWVDLLAGTGSEADPQVGTLTANKWCSANAGGTAIDCTADAPATGAAGSASEVQFRDSGTGTFAADPALVWDDTNNRIGIGITSPLSKVHVSGFANTDGGIRIQSAAGAQSHIPFADGEIYLSTDTSPGVTGTGDINFRAHNGATYTNLVTMKGDTGNVGIGTTSPLTRLHVAGSITLAGYGQIVPPDTTTGINVCGQSSGYPNGGCVVFRGNDGGVGGTATNGLELLAGGSERMRIAANGNVGIGTTTPGQKLDVMGSVDIGSRLFVGANGTESNASLVHFQNGSATTGGILRASQGTNDTADAPLWYQASSHLFALDSGNVTIPMAIVSSGKVGIGTTSPAANLHVYDTDNYAEIKVHSAAVDGYAVLSMKNDAREWRWQVQGQDADKLYLWDNTTENVRMVVDTSGNVGINVPNPSYRLDVNGTVRLANLTSGNGVGTVCIQSGYPISWTASNTCVPSDIRYKERIQTLTGALDTVMKLRGVTYYWNEKSGMPRNVPEIGFIAQEVEKIAPQLVKTTGKDSIKSVTYDHATALLVEAIKELKADNDNLRAELDLMRADIEALKEAAREALH